MFTKKEKKTGKGSFKNYVRGPLKILKNITNVLTNILGAGGPKLAENI